MAPLLLLCAWVPADDFYPTGITIRDRTQRPSLDANGVPVDGSDGAIAATRESQTRAGVQVAQDSAIRIQQYRRRRETYTSARFGIG
jgi:hypothetical protein